MVSSQRKITKYLHGILGKKIEMGVVVQESKVVSAYNQNSKNLEI